MPAARGEKGKIAIFQLWFRSRYDFYQDEYAILPNPWRKVPVHGWIALEFHENLEEVIIQLFQREARMVGQISRPHIIPIREMGVSGEYHYIALRFVEGKTLREYLGKDQASFSLLTGYTFLRYE